MPAVPDLQSGGAQLKLEAPPGKAYLLTWSKDHFAARLAERSCIIVYADGRDCHRASDWLCDELCRSGCVASPRRQRQKSEPGHAIVVDQTRPASEVEVTRLVIPRATTIQRLSFGSYFNVLGNSRKVGGISNLQYGVNQDRNLIRPLQQWLEKTIESNKLPGFADSRATNCLPH